MNFYIHCLTSTLFRKEFKQQIKFIWGKNQSLVGTMELNQTNQRIQTHRMAMKY